jgi:hypothetical protein
VRLAEAIFFGAMAFFLAATSCGGFQRPTPSEPAPLVAPVTSATPLTAGRSYEADLACGERAFVGPFDLSDGGGVTLQTSVQSGVARGTCVTATWVDARGAFVDAAEGFGCSPGNASAPVAATVRRAASIPPRLYLAIAVSPRVCQPAKITLRRL